MSERRRSDRRGVDSDPSTGMLLQMIMQNHEQAEAGHGRLRSDVRELEKAIERIVSGQNLLSERVSKIENTPLSVEKVSFNGKQLTAIVGACIVLAGGMWQLHTGIDNLQTSIQSSAKLQDERNETQKQMMDQLRAAIEMRRVEIQNLSNYIQQNVTARPVTRP